MKKRWMINAVAMALFITPISVLGDTPEMLPDLPTVHQNLSLDAAIHLAIQNNLAMKQAQADSDLAASSVHATHAQTKPSISTTTYATVGDSANILTSSPGVMPQNSFGVPSGGFADQNIMVMVPIFTGKTLQKRTEAAQAQSHAARLSITASSILVKEQVTEAYARILEQQALVGVAQARVTAEDEQVRITQERVRVGRSAPVDLLREQAAAAEAHQGLLEAQNNTAVSLIQFKTVLGVSQLSEVAITDTLETIELPIALPNDLGAALHQAEKNRPELASALRQIEAAQATVQATQGAYQPQVYAVGMGDANLTSQGIGRAGYTIGLTASLPLYDGGQRRAETDGAHAKLDRAKADASVMRQTIDQDVATAWLTLQTTTAQIETTCLGASAAQEGYTLADLRYNAGKSVTAERLDALSALTRAQGAVAQAKALRIIALARLQAALGL